MAGTVGVVNGSLIRRIADSSSGYWKEYALYPQAFRITGGAPTPVDANANTLGGYQLNDAGEILAFNTHVDDDWDGESDILIDLYFEINAAGGAPTDTVDFDVAVYMKKPGDTSTRSQSLTATKTIGAAAQFTAFESEATLVHDDGANPVNETDTLTIEVNLNTGTSEVDDVILNYVEIKYRMLPPNLER